jgi:predicted AAA+ superfamily ATPase
VNGEALADSPVVLIHSPRQCGKTTLAQQVGKRAGYAYFSFDDGVALAAAEGDPVGFVADLPERAILDEVQRVPAQFTAADFRGLRKLRDAAGARFAAGAVLYDDETSASFGEGVYAVPIRALWEMV